MGTEAEKLSARANRHAHDIRNGGYRGAADCMDALAAALKAAEANAYEWRGYAYGYNDKPEQFETRIDRLEIQKQNLLANLNITKAALKAAEAERDSYRKVGRAAGQVLQDNLQRIADLERDLTAARAELAMAVPAIETLKRVRSELEIEIERLREGLRKIHEAHDSYVEHNPAAKENPDWLDDVIHESRALGEQGK